MPEKPAPPVLTPLLFIHAPHIPLIFSARLMTRCIFLVERDLQQSQIFRVTFECCVCEVADEGHQADEEVDEDVEDHLDFDVGGEPAFDGAAFFEDEEGHGDTDGVAGEGDDADYGFPAEADAEEVEEAHVLRMRELAGGSSGRGGCLQTRTRR